MSKTKNSGGRTRNFATVVYPDSAPENWLSLLEEQKVPVLVSPLHEDDINPDGEKKKAHWHVMILFDSVKTENQAMEVIESFNGVGYERVNSVRAYARYLCHLDNPDKAQYNTNLVVQMGGADYQTIIGLPSDKYSSISEMIDFCEDNRIYSYSDLINYSRIHRQDWFRSLCDNSTMVMKEYLKSKSWTERRKIDQLTGELLTDEKEKTGQDNQ